MATVGAEKLSWLRARWWLPLLALAVCAVAIGVLAPRYPDAQVAENAAAFYAAVADAGDGRTAAAGVADMLFVVAYFTTALALSRPTVASRVGLAVMGVAAAADMIENTMVVIGATTGDASDGYVDAIRGFGVVKWGGVVIGALLMLAGLVLARLRDQRVHRGVDEGA